MLCSNAVKASGSADPGMTGSKQKPHVTEEEGGGGNWSGCLTATNLQCVGHKNIYIREKLTELNYVVIVIINSKSIVN